MEKQVTQMIYEPGDKIMVPSKGDIPSPRDLVEQMYCSEQIHIPPTFPYILRQYCKAAIRTQPYDLLKWTTAYFRAMAEGDVPPVKQRLEYPPTDIPSGLTPGYLRVILRQLRMKKVVPTELLESKWGGLCLNFNALKEILQIGQFTDDEVDVLKFVAIAAGHLTDALRQTMIVLCEILTEEPEGGSAMIPFSTFCDLYTFLAKIDCGPPLPDEPTPEEEVEEKEGSEIRDDEELSEEEAEEAADEDAQLAEDKQELENIESSDILEEDETKEGESMDLHSEDTASENMQNIPVSSSTQAQSEEGHKELGLGSSGIVGGVGQDSEETESGMKQEEASDTLDNVSVQQESTSTSHQQDTEQTGETNEENDKDDQTTEETDEGGQAMEKTDEGDQAMEKTDEGDQAMEKTDEGDQAMEKTDDDEANEKPDKDDQTSEETDKEDLSATKEVAADVAQSISEEFEGGEQSDTVIVKEEKSSERVAAETVDEVVCRGAVAAAATEAEITAAEFVMRLQRKARIPKKEWVPREARKKQKPRPVHYEVPGIGPPVPDDQIDKVITYMHYWAARQEGMVMPRNIYHFLCPLLDAVPPPEPIEIPEEKCKCKENKDCIQCICEQVQF